MMCINTSGFLLLTFPKIIFSKFRRFDFKKNYTRGLNNHTTNFPHPPTKSSSFFSYFCTIHVPSFHQFRISLSQTLPDTYPLPPPILLQEMQKSITWYFVEMYACMYYVVVVYFLQGRNSTIVLLPLVFF